MDAIPNDKLLDLFIRTLKDKIQHEVCLFKPTSVEKDFMVARKFESKNMAMATRRTTSKTYKDNNVPSSKPLQPIRLTPQQIYESRAKYI